MVNPFTRFHQRPVDLSQDKVLQQKVALLVQGADLLRGGKMPAIATTARPLGMLGHGSRDKTVLWGVEEV